MSRTKKTSGTSVREPDVVAPRETDEVEESLWSKLKIPPPRFRAEELAPQVDEELLGRLLRRELPTDAARRTYELIASFRSWNVAYIRMSVENYRESRRR